jgi:hypothetical protein
MSKRYIARVEHIKVPAWDGVMYNTMSTVSLPPPNREPDSYIDVNELHCPICDGLVYKTPTPLMWMGKFWTCYTCKRDDIIDPEWNK